MHQTNYRPAPPRIPLGELMMLPRLHNPFPLVSQLVVQHDVQEI